ncbi:MAG: type II toxin-antitoxin system RelE/ParE family toxin [Propionibacteriaceae bacterium]|nr:type II toxin-antitoxin system RelE/ParE family toxin [Propionibacteriaceae bacterium]
MAYRIVVTHGFEKSLKKIGQANAVVVMKWIVKNLEGTAHPRLHGKRLRYTLKQYWRYRIGAFRLLAQIVDDQLILELMTVAHWHET